MSRLWGWLKQWHTTSSQPKRTDLLTVIAQQNQRLIDLLEKQHATLDRVVQAKFDVPVAGHATEQRESQPMFPSYMMSDTLSDAEFLEKADRIA